MELMGEGIHPVLTASKPPGVHPAFPGIYKYIYIYLYKKNNNTGTFIRLAGLVLPATLVNSRSPTSRSIFLEL